MTVMLYQEQNLKALTGCWGFFIIMNSNQTIKFQEITTLFFNKVLLLPQKIHYLSFTLSHYIYIKYP